MYNTYLVAGFAALCQATSNHNNRSEGELADASTNAAQWKRSAQDHAQMLHRRQDPPRPPYTEYPVCDDEDGYFYVTEFGNMTFQIQCTTIYLGGQDNYAPTDDLYGCIDFCASLNTALRGSCLGINWNAPFVGAGDCFTFSSIIDTLSAFEGGGYQEAALLIYGGDGAVYATPRPFLLPSSTTEASPSSTDTSSSASSTLPSGSKTTTTAASSSFTGTVAQSSTPTGSAATATGTSTGTSSIGIDPGLGSTTTTSSTANTFVFPTTTSLETCTTSTTTITSRITLAICPPGASCGTPVPAPSTTPSTSTTTSVMATSAIVPSTTSFTTSFTTSVPPPTTGPNGQVTAFETIPVTVFEVQPLLMCDPSGRCSPSAQTDTIVSIRTGLSCSPDVCSGDMINTEVDALFAAPTCVLLL